jgi:hypothetical protein
MISRESIRVLICAFGAALLFTFRLPAGAQSLSPELSVDNAVATAGYYRLSWRPVSDHIAGLQYELQEARDGAFRQAVTLYRGPDRATVLSGRDDGLRYYRIRTLRDNLEAGAWSTALAVETRHHPLGRALSFLFLGAVVFLSTLILVLRGARGSREAGVSGRDR